MDKLEELVHLFVEARAKARELQRFALDAESRARVAELMATAKKTHGKLQHLNQACQGNGKGLDKTALNTALDELIETFKGVNKKLDKLLAQAKR